MTTFLTEAAAAELLGWSKQKVKRLRLAGKLPYIPGRPPTIALDDIKALRCRNRPVSSRTEPQGSTTPTGPIPVNEANAAEAAVRLRARRTWLKLRFGSRNF